MYDILKDQERYSFTRFIPLPGTPVSYIPAKPLLQCAHALPFSTTNDMGAIHLYGFAAYAALRRLRLVA